MILDISNKAFKNIFGDGKFDLPIRWDGKNFEDSLKDLFQEYIFRKKYILLLLALFTSKFAKNYIFLLNVFTFD